MGIPKFFRFLQESYPDIVSPNLVKRVASLWIDANAKIYTACDNVYGIKFNKRNPEESLLKNKQAHDPKNAEKTYSDCIVETILVLKNLIERIKPEESLGIMFDGIIPLAKIYQTRERRYRSAQDNASEHDDDDDEDDKSDELDDAKSFKNLKKKLKDYDRIMITPGTKFMYDIDLNVSKWIASDNPIFPPQKVYSSYKSDTHGEGEHKIFEYLKKYYGKNGQFSKLESEETKYHVIHGLDADLILLALLSEVEGIILMRHDHGNYVMIDRLRNHILRDLVVDSNANVNPKILISDFCCMMALIGNDFLKPHMMCEKMENAIPMLVEAYHKLGKQFTDLEGKINFDVLNDYFKILVDQEKGLILDHLRDAMKQNIQYRSFPAEMTLAKIRKLVKIKDNIPTDEKETKEEAEKVEEYIKKNESKVYQLFRSEYNTNVVVPYSYTAFNKLEIADIKDVIDVTNTKSKTRNFCFRYLEGIQWNIIYYLYGHNKTRNNWGFNYHYSPLMIDIVEYMKTSRSLKKLDMDKIKVSEQKWHGLVSQALCVIPKTKSDILPKSLQKYYSEEQLGLLDQFPISYKIDYFNFENNIHSRVLTNFPDIDLIIDTVEAAPIKQNTAIYSLTSDYESRVPDLSLAIENRIKNIAMERQKESFTKKFTYRRKEEGEVDVSRKLAGASASGTRGRGSSRGGRGRGSVARGGRGRGK